MRVLGIDPGLSGGLVLLDWPALRLQVMPVCGTGKAGAQQVDRRRLLDLIAELRPDHAFLEQVHSMPKQGIASTWNFARSVEALEMALVALKIPYSLVTPQRWQGWALKDQPKGDTKAAAARKVAQLWPGIDFKASPRCKKAHEGLVDAALIARYGLYTLAQETPGEKGSL